MKLGLQRQREHKRQGGSSGGIELGLVAQGDGVAARGARPEEAGNAEFFVFVDSAGLEWPMRTSMLTRKVGRRALNPMFLGVDQFDNGEWVAQIVQGASNVALAYDSDSRWISQRVSEHAGVCKTSGGKGKRARNMLAPATSWWADGSCSRPSAFRLLLSAFCLLPTAFCLLRPFLNDPINQE